MCKKCSYYGIISSNLINDNHRLLNENIRLRKQLHDANVRLKQIIAQIKTTKEALSEVCGENQ